MTDEFVNLHTHTHSSAFDGLGQEGDFAARASDLGQPAIAFTEHGSVRGFYGAHLACQKAGIKFIPGCEMYLVDDADRRGLSDAEKAEIRGRAKREGEDEKAALKKAEGALRDRDHVTVWAMNDEGVRSLYRLTTWAWSKGYYYKPRVDLRRLIEFGDGLIVSSGCPSGVISAPIRAGRIGDAVDRAEALAAAFGDRFYFEIMPHVIDGAARLPEKLIRIADRVGARVVATQDAHYPAPEDSVAQEVLLCIQTKDSMSNPDRFRFPTRDFWLRSRGEMEAAFLGAYPGIGEATVRRALDETVAFADRITAVVPTAKPGSYMVAPAIPPWIASYDAWLLDLCREGCVNRFGVGIEDLPEGYGQRLIHEVRTICGLGFSSYFVAAWDIRKWARDQGIFSGPGRGSAAGSLVAYLLRITDLDPIKHGLMFERFLAPGRKDLPDVDMDFDADRRDEVIDHLRDQYGEDRVARISTANMLGGRGTLRDLGRVYGIPEKDIAPVAGLIVNAIAEEDQSDTTLQEALEGTDAGRSFRDRYPDVAAVAARVEGNLRSVGVHASGVVISSVPIVDVAPVETRSIKGKARSPVVAFDMAAVDAVGLVKFDVLPLTALTTIDRACKISGVDVAQIDFEDPEVLQAFTDGRFTGIFQFDSPSARRICRGFKFRRMADVAVITAVNRPGPAKTGLAREYVDRAADPSKIRSVHPIYDEVFAETFGVPVYQEQVVTMARRVGYSPEEADAFRKKISKKKGLGDEQPKFVGGAVAAGMDEEIADRLFRDLLGFASYAFNKAHAYSYAALAIWTMWFKVHRPAAFFTAFLATETDAEVQLRLAGEARRCGIPVLPPDVQVSESRFSLDESTGKPVVVGSLADLKGIGRATADAIASRRPFRGLGDFYRRTVGEGVKVTARTFEILARATALRSVCPGVPTRVLVDNARVLWDAMKRGIDPVIDPGASLPEYSTDQIRDVASTVYPLYVDHDGHSAFETIDRKIRAACDRPIILPGEVDLDQSGFVLLAARLSAVKLYPAEDGKKTGRAILTDPDGNELPARIDPDVLDACASTLATARRPVLAAVTVSAAGRASVEAIWPAADVISGVARDAVLQWILHPPKTTPRNPRKVIDAAVEETIVGIEGVVVRVRRSKDKNGGKMWSVGLLGERGYVRFWIFASRMREDVRAIVPGAHVYVRVEKMRGDAACLGHADVRVRDPGMAGEP